MQISFVTILDTSTIYFILAPCSTLYAQRNSLGAQFNLFIAYTNGWTCTTYWAFVPGICSHKSSLSYMYVYAFHLFSFLYLGGSNQFILTWSVATGGQPCVLSVKQKAHLELHKIPTMAAQFRCKRRKGFSVFFKKMFKRGLCQRVASSHPKPTSIKRHGSDLLWQDLIELRLLLCNTLQQMAIQEKVTWWTVEKRILRGFYSPTLPQIPNFSLPYHKSYKSNIYHTIT